MFHHCMILCAKVQLLYPLLFIWVPRHMFKAEMSDWEIIAATILIYLSTPVHVWNWDVWLRDLPEYPGTCLKVRCLTERLTWVSRHMFEAEMSDWEIIAATILIYLRIAAHVWSWDVWLRDYSSHHSHLPEYLGTCLKLRCLTERL